MPGASVGLSIDRLVGQSLSRSVCHSAVVRPSLGRTNIRRLHPRESRPPRWRRRRRGGAFRCLFASALRCSAVLNYPTENRAFAKIGFSLYTAPSILRPSTIPSGTELLLKTKTARPIYSPNFDYPTGNRAFVEKGSAPHLFSKSQLPRREPGFRSNQLFAIPPYRRFPGYPFGSKDIRGNSSPALSAPTAS